MHASVECVWAQSGNEVCPNPDCSSQQQIDNARSARVGRQRCSILPLSSISDCSARSSSDACSSCSRSERWKCEQQHRSRSASFCTASTCCERRQPNDTCCERRQLNGGHRKEEGRDQRRRQSQGKRRQRSSRKRCQKRSRSRKHNQESSQRRYALRM